VSRRPATRDLHLFGGWQRLSLRCGSCCRKTVGRPLIPGAELLYRPLLLLLNANKNGVFLDSLEENAYLCRRFSAYQIPATI
jgi:hypothetical protein